MIDLVTNSFQSRPLHKKFLFFFFSISVTTCKYCQTPASISTYPNDPKFSDRHIWANSVDPDREQSDQGLHCLPYRLHLLDALFYSKTILFKF